MIFAKSAWGFFAMQCVVCPESVEKMLTCLLIGCGGMEADGGLLEMRASWMM
jgi:hypothetical protein